MTRFLYAAVDDLLLMSPERLMAKKIVEQIGPKNSKQSESQTLEISQEELAALVGVSRQSVNRTLRIWEENGYIVRKYGKTVVCQRAALRQIFDSPN